MERTEIRPEGSALSRFVASGYGRAIRVGGGLALVVGGLIIGWPAGAAVAVAGLLPLATGVFGLCPMAPLWGGHFFGSAYCRPRK